MMKIQNVKLANINFKEQKGKTSTLTNVTLTPINANTVLNHLDASNKRLINFTGKAPKEINEDYFHLSKGASPDIYQKMAAKELQDGKDVLVTAPTGTGKTAIAYYIISKNLKDGKQTFYTTPLKALSNQKYRDMQKIYGEKNVGLLTGDAKINVHAPIIVMTTEIYRNMVFGEKIQNNNRESAKEPKTVIFDELHYLGDVDRGGIWEQSIILSDENTQLLSLSATIGNNKIINDWMGGIKDKENILINVPPERRHVPLTFNTEECVASKPTGNKKQVAEKYQVPDENSYLKIIEKLKQSDQLPTILFVFSKKTSSKLLSSFGLKGNDLTTLSEKNTIEEIIKRYKNEGTYLGHSINIPALKKGYAIHNAGLLPVQKELVEELFQKKLVKVVIATETLSAGINMPARSVVISSTRKPTSASSIDGTDGKRDLSVNEFHQMSGRAGRRGMDKEGFVYVMPVNSIQSDKFNLLIKSPPSSLDSHFNPGFSFIAGYYKSTKDDKIIKELIGKSLYVFNEEENIAKNKAGEMFEKFNKKKELLVKEGFLRENNVLTEKGELLSLINGYEQIPVINSIYDKKLANLSVFEFAASVGTLANIAEEKINLMEENGAKKGKKKNKKAEKEKKFRHSSAKLEEFVSLLDKSIKEYNKEVGSLHLTKAEQNKSAAKNIYNWAFLNGMQPENEENWKKAFEKSEEIQDEGTLFKQIAQTIDLLKQMRKIAKVGLEMAEFKKDSKKMEYYKDLSFNIEQSIELLYQRPIKHDEKI